MTFDHSATRIRRTELDREIDSIRTERLLVVQGPQGDGRVERVRRAAGRFLIAAGTGLVGRDDSPPLRLRQVDRL